MLKRCASCKLSKSTKYFPLKRKGSTELYEYCKKCARAKNKTSYLINKEKYVARTHEYARSKNWFYQKKYAREHPGEIKYAGLKCRCKGKVKVMPKKIFLKWFYAQKLECTYCGLKLTKMSNIDRMNPKLGYIEGNVTISCMRCNMIKNNFFTPEQMKEIANKYIKPRLRKDGLLNDL